MKQTELFCWKQSNTYIDFFEHPSLVKMCGAKTEEIVKVIVREAKENEPSTHYGWWDNAEQQFTLIFETLHGVAMCFPYGYKAEVERGRGNIYRLVVLES